MATNINTKKNNRIRRHARGRAKLFGTAERPRVSVFKSNKHMYVQAIDDAARRTLAGISDRALKPVKTDAVKDLSSKVNRAFQAGQQLAEALKKHKISKAIFDKGGFKYHGRVKAVAEGLRHGGINI